MRDQHPTVRACGWWACVECGCTNDPQAAHCAVCQKSRAHTEARRERCLYTPPCDPLYGAAEDCSRDSDETQTRCPCPCHEGDDA